MKKFLALFLVFAMLFTMAACGKTETPTGNDDAASVDVVEKNDEEQVVTEEVGATTEEDKKVESSSDAAQNADKEPSTPSTSQTVGNVLFADFKAKVGSAGSMLSLAESLIAHDMIPFAGGANEIEPGLLAGFGNTEIKGFKSGASFGPMMGTQPFIGYVFELESGTDVNTFISTLKGSADLRWNVCTEAEEMVVGNVGNKVFFVMCPKQFEE